MKHWITSDLNTISILTKHYNRVSPNRHVVMVQGPGDREATMMPIADAIENGFFYSWGV